MTIYLLSRDLEMFLEWKQVFEKCTDVDVVMDDFAHFMDSHKVQCVVSPANSYGCMDGGYDTAITAYFGPALEKAVKKYINLGDYNWEIAFFQYKLKSLKEEGGCADFMKPFFEEFEELYKSLPKPILL